MIEDTKTIEPPESRASAGTASWAVRMCCLCMLSPILIPLALLAAPVLLCQFMAELFGLFVVYLMTGRNLLK